MKSSGVKTNFIFQILYQVVMLVIPLVISPYLTRVLQDENLGIYTFTYSIAYYFVVAAMLGIAKYGQRIIALRKNNEESLRKTFWSLFFVHLIFSIISLLGYTIFAVCQKDDRLIYIMQIFYVASALFDITWLFYGLESFKSVVIKNFIIKIISTVLIFVFVKSIDDLWIYTLIMSSSVLLGQVCLLPQAIRNVKPCKFSKCDCIEHIKPLFVLSIAVVAATLYTVFDKTLLGWFFNNQKEKVGYYEYSYKIIQIPCAIITVIGTVLFPRSCACYAKNDMVGMEKYFKLSLYFTYFIGFAAVLGLIAISDLFVVEYYGDKFVECANIIKLMTPLILILSIGDAIRTQYLIPMGKDLAYIIIAIFNAILNIGLSCIFIPIVGVFGAVIGTISAELLGTTLQTIICRKNIKIKSIFISMIPFILASGIMYGTILLIQMKFNSSIWDLIIQIIIGGTIYVLVVIGLFLLRKDYRNNIINYVKKKLKKGNESKQEHLVENRIEESNEEKEVLENE